MGLKVVFSMGMVQSISQQRNTPFLISVTGTSNLLEHHEVVCALFQFASKLKSLEFSFFDF